MLVAIEGVDGCGKSTQVALLVEHLTALGHDTHLASFPRYADPIFGDLIKRYLRGDLGELSSVDPRLVALMFAGDRAAEAPILRQALCEDRIVVCDRYFYSNLAYQAARLDDDDVAEFVMWLRKLEFGHYAVPVPACSIYLDVHHDVRRQRLAARQAAPAEGSEAIPNDIHERDLDLQSRVEELFRAQAETQDDLIRVDCHSDGQWMTPAEVQARILRVLSARGLVTEPAAASVPGS